MEIVLLIFGCVALLLVISFLTLFVLRVFMDVVPDLQEYVSDFISRRRKANIIEWNPCEKMSKELAIKAIKDTQSFYRRLYLHPEIRPFNDEAEYEGAQQVLEGLKEVIASKEMRSVEKEVDKARERRRFG